VIPTYNRPDHVQGVLEALAMQTFPRTQFEVILVDDGGTLPLDDVVLQFRDRVNITLLKQCNGGCSAARQRGTEIAVGNYLAFTDDDCRPAADWLERFAEILSKQSSCAIGGLTYSAIADSVCSEITQYAANFLIEAEQCVSDSVQYCPTSNIVFPAEEYRLVGGLDKTWRVNGGEDRDLCSRWIRAGFKLLYRPDIKAAHLNAMTLKQFFFRHFNYGRGSYLYHLQSRVSDRSRSFESWRRYLGFLLFPLRNAGLVRGIAPFLILLTAQWATAIGFFFQFGQRVSRAFNQRVIETESVPNPTHPNATKT
jgi:glycosyltransferase involved in cell wall biosynthesis